MNDFPQFNQKLIETFALKSEVSSIQADWNETDSSKPSFIKNKPGTFKTTGPYSKSCSAYNDVVISSFTLDKGIWVFFGCCFVNDNTEGYRMICISTDNAFHKDTIGVGNSKIPQSFLHTFRVIELSATTTVNFVARCEIDSSLVNCYFQAFKIK